MRKKKLSNQENKQTKMEKNIYYKNEMNKYGEQIGWVIKNSQFPTLQMNSL